MIILPASLSPYCHSKMSVICPHESAGNMRIMWMNLVQISPFPYGLLMQQQFKVTHVQHQQVDF